MEHNYCLKTARAHQSTVSKIDFKTLDFQPDKKFDIVGE